MVDVNVLFSGVGWQGTPYTLLQHALINDFKLVLTEYIIEKAYLRIGQKIPYAISTYDEFLAQCDYDLVSDPSTGEIAQNLSLVPDDVEDVPIALAAIQAKVDLLSTTTRDGSGISANTQFSSSDH